MFPRKAPASQSVFSYNNRVVVKRAECMADTVLIVDKEDFMLWTMLMGKISPGLEATCYLSPCFPLTGNI